MPAYNAEEFIALAIESVLVQDYPNRELIVVDDGSTDSTAAIIRRYGPRVRYEYQSNAGQAAARNRGIRHSTGELIAFIDADDVWLPPKLARQVALLEQSPDLGLVYCSTEEIDSAGCVLRPRPAQLRGSVVRSILLGRYSGAELGSTALVPRAVLSEIGDFDALLPPCEDTDLFWRIATRYRVDFVPEPLVQYRMHGRNAHSDLNRMTRAWTLLYRKAIRDPEIRRLGLIFRARCRARLYHLLAGENACHRRWRPAIVYGIRSIAAWPPSVFRAAFHTVRRLWGPARNLASIEAIGRPRSSPRNGPQNPRSLRKRV
jgi:glycosyltransferase involved in cell wall biosynthesis